MAYAFAIVGAGIAGSALAHALGNQGHRVLLLERSLAEPDRIVGELLQPGGVEALRNLGLEDCVENIDAIRVHGYNVIHSGKSVHIPYNDNQEGRSFHHGRFIMRLRDAAKRAPGVDVVEGAVTELVEEDGAVVGVRATVNGTPQTFKAAMVVVADGCFSNFRNQVMGTSAIKPNTKSNFVGVVLEDVTLPIPKHGTVVLVKGFGPVLLYQIGTRDTRILIDLPNPPPADIKDTILTHILPQLPASVQPAIVKALSTSRIRRMPNSFLPPVQQGLANSKRGVVLLGDAWNMRHPLTGGGMTVALTDVVLFRDLVPQLPPPSTWTKNWHVVRAGLLQKLHWQRKSLSSTVNILSVALYDLFGAEDDDLDVLRTGCFKYFECGGECVRGPVGLLSGMARSPSLLAYHFFSVAFYAIWVLFTHPRVITIPASANSKPKTITKPPPPIWRYPFLAIKSIRVFYTAAVVFIPLLWTEIRWWSPTDRRPLYSYILSSLFLISFIVALIAFNVAFFVYQTTPLEVLRYVQDNFSSGALSSIEESVYTYSGLNVSVATEMVARPLRQLVDKSGLLASR